MRCYFMRNGHIAGVEILDGITDDAAAIKRGSALFLDRVRERCDGFEIWERDRVVFRYPDDENAADPTSSNGKSSSTGKSAARHKKTAPCPAQATA